MILMRERKDFVKPPVNPCFFKGEIQRWKFREATTLVHGKYAYRFRVEFEDGSVVLKEKGGFCTKKECLDAREVAISQLNNHQFVFFEVTVKEFYDYWLYYYMIDQKQIAYGTAFGYRNIINKYIIPVYGHKKLVSIRREMLTELLVNMPSPSLYQMAASVIGSSYKCAKQMNLVNVNVGEKAIRQSRKILAQRAAEAPPVDTKRPVIDSLQIQKLLIECKISEPEFFLPLAITLSTGCRISELIALKFSSVDFRTGELSITGQLGRPLITDRIPENQAYKQVLKPKTHHSIRAILLPQFVLDEIILTKKRREMKVRGDPSICDDGYIWAQENGDPHGRGAYKKPFARLKEKLGLDPNLHWHDLRHSFATVMTENNINPKELSQAMGHYESDFTQNVYVDSDQIINNGFPEYYRFLDDIVPSTEFVSDLNLDWLIEEVCGPFMKDAHTGDK